MTSRVLCLFLVWLIPYILVGQTNPRFRQITKKEGLSNNTVFAIEEDQEGFMWFATRNGLNRYDGYRIENIYKKDDSSESIISNDIRVLFYDTLDHHLWVGTQNGLSMISRRQSGIPSFLKGLSITGLIRTKNYGMCVGSTSGFFHLSQDSSFVSVSSFPEEVKINSVVSVFAIYEDRSERVWVASDEHLMVSKNPKKPEFVLASGFNDELRGLNGLKLNVIFQDINGDFWFGSDGQGLFRWSERSSELINYVNSIDDPSSISSDRIRAIETNSAGEVIVGTSVGVNIYKPENDGFDRIVNDESNPDGLSNNSIHSLNVDRNGGLWVGTYYRGINYTYDSFQRFNISYPFSGKLNDDRNIISTISSDIAGNVWVGTEGKGISTWNNKSLKFEFLDFSEAIETPNVKVIYPDQNDVWIGTFKDGLYRINKNREIIDHYFADGVGMSKIPSNNVYDVQRIENQIFIGTFGGGLVVKNQNTGTTEQYVHNLADSNSIVSNRIRMIHEDHDGDIWLGTLEGVSRVVTDINSDYSFESYLHDIDVYCITSFRPGEIWIGTLFYGMFRFDKRTKKFESYSAKNGLLGNTVYSILPDGINLWLTTNKGIVKFNSNTEEFTSYSSDLELEGLDYRPNSAHRFRNNMYLFGSNSGLVSFNPKDLAEASYIPPVVLSSIKMLGETHPLQLFKSGSSFEKIILDYAKSNLEISFSALDYSNPENNKYAYRMKGMDEDWIQNMGNPQAIYTFQREGSYTFEFKGSNSDGVWNPKISSIQIEVSAPWYRSFWAYVFYYFVLIGLLFLIYRMIKLRNSYHIEHISKVEQERSHQMKTRFFTNITHELRTPLTLMQGPLQDIIRKDNVGGPVRSKLEGVHKNVVRLSQLVNQLLDFRKLETDHMKMHVVEGDIIDFLKEIYFAFKEETTKRQIDFIFESSSEHINCWYDADKVEKVFFNLLSNALKFTQDSGLIKFTVVETKDEIIIKVIDNGLGIDDSIKEQIFERFYERNSINYHHGAGIGLALSKQLVELHGGQIYVDNNEASGSIFSVKLKKGSSHFAPADIAKIERFVNPENEQAVETKLLSDSNITEMKLLVVEDASEIRDYLKSLFSTEYSVLLAANGEQGFQMASTQLPDIIISDVMMPIMDGITMCSKLKTTLETSHIPVILLTARSSTPYKIGGLETGADDYITKPFNSEELLLKVKNTLSARTAYLDKLSRTHDFTPEKIAITSTDEKFLKRLMGITEEHIENSHLTVEQIADHMNVSRALLFTKIKSLTGTTPKGFIKEFRLQRAAQLLRDTDLNVSEVANKAGFKYRKYFTKVFKEKFGETPKNYSEGENTAI